MDHNISLFDTEPEFSPSIDGSMKFDVDNNAFDYRREWSETPISAFENWMARSRSGRGFKDRSRTVYLSMWKKLIKLGGKECAFMDAQAIEVFLKSVQGRGSALPSPTQQRRYLVLLASVQDDLVMSGCLKRNCARELLDMPTMKEAAFRRNLPVALSPVQEESIKSMIDQWSDKDGAHWRALRDAALVAMVLGSGLKVHELQSLKIADVAHEATGKTFVRVTTNGAKERRAPMSPVFEKSVMRWLIWLRDQNAPWDVPAFLSSTDENSAAIDPSLELEWASTNTWAMAKPMSATQIWRVVQVMFTQCGIDERLARHGPTVLRNTFATRQLRAGVSIGKLALWLGHKDVRSTEVFRSLLIEPGALPSS